MKRPMLEVIVILILLHPIFAAQSRSREHERASKLLKSQRECSQYACFDTDLIESIEPLFVDKVAPREAIPYLAQIYQDNSSSESTNCVGVIMNPRQVLTLASCLPNIDQSLRDFHVKVNGYKWADGEDLRVLHIVRDMAPGAEEEKVALINLEQDVKFAHDREKDRFVWSICLSKLAKGRSLDEVIELPDIVSKFIAPSWSRKNKPSTNMPYVNGIYDVRQEDKGRYWMATSHYSPYLKGTPLIETNMVSSSVLRGIYLSENCISKCPTNCSPACPSGCSKDCEARFINIKHFAIADFLKKHLSP